MIGRKKVMTAVFKELELTAAKAKRELHPSFKVELENYSRHRIVKSLPEDDLKIVLKGIGETAIAKSGTTATILGGDRIRTIIVDLCDDPFSDCSRAAIRVLKKAQRHTTAANLQDQLMKLYKN